MHGPRPVVIAVLILSTTASAARAADIGEIAVIEDTAGAINGAGLVPQFYLGKASCAFLKGHQDRYDVIVFFTTIPQSQFTGAPVGWPVRAPAKGLGLDAWLDQSQAFCTDAAGRLRHAVRMGDLATLPDSPDALYKPYPSTFTGIEVLAHEIGHQWLALVNFKLASGVKHCILRAFGGSGSSGATDCDGHATSDYNQHWSFYFNNPSLMYGSAIQDLGGGAFRATHAPKKYTPLDQYLMGLRSKADVPPLFVVDLGDPAGAKTITPPLLPGKTLDFKGKRLDFTIDDVIRAEGARVPASEGCHLKAAFAIIHATGAGPDAKQLAKVEAYRKRLETFYPLATDNRGSIDTTLAGTGKGTAGCPPSGLQPDGGVAPPDAAGTVEDQGSTDANAQDSSAGDAGVDAAGTPDDAGDDGCGCTAGRADGEEHSALLLLAAFALLRRRRRR